MAGIHVHPHDITDEGCGSLLERLDKMRDLQYIFPEVNTIFERNPYPTGKLPHNPVHDFVQGEGTLHVKLDGESVGTRLRQRVDPSIEQGADPMLDLLRAAEGSRYRIVPWINLLNGDFQGDTASNGVVDYQGRPVDHWLCPNGPDVVPMWTDIILGIARRYGTKTFLIDRIRFPDWAGKEVSPRNLFSCFCPRCLTAMHAAGIDVDRLKKEMTQICVLLADHQYEQAANLLKRSATLAAFFSFRRDSVSAMVEKLLGAVRESEPAIELWLDLWPPSYAWLLGQDYGRLTRASGKLKHFPYHKLGGGADVQGLISYFADTPERQEQAFRAFMQLFGMPYSISYAQFRRQGFPIEFVRAENERVRALSQPGTFIFSGVQMWNLTPAELLEAISAARASEADDILYYCYGWAEDELMDAAGAAGRAAE